MAPQLLLHGPEGFNLPDQLQLSWLYMGARLSSSAAEVCQGSDAVLASQEPGLPGTQFQARLGRPCLAFDYFGS